ncbi:MAG: HprK-related kinase A [Rhodocyclaceae bacterium]|nr:HprK-related kinase A [Rhodocyclaceae bacterium]
MIVRDLPRSELRNRLREGLPIRTGPFVNRVSTRLALVENAIALLYGQYPLEESGFADFHVRVARPAGLRRWISPQVFFYIDGLAPFNPLPAKQAFPMLEWGLNWCISAHCHRHLILHAAVVERNGRALILPAPPGSGKSTLCAGLIQRGWRLLSDELAMIDPATFALTPIPRPVSLKNASIEVIRAFAPQAVISPVVFETVKGTVAHLRPPSDSVRRANETAPPGWLVLPQFVAGAPARLEPLSKAHAVAHLAENAFNFSLHGQQGFELLAAVVEASACFSFTYSRLDEAAEVFARLADGQASPG